MEKPHCNKYFNISMPISTAICILLNFPQSLNSSKGNCGIHLQEQISLFTFSSQKQCQFEKGIKKATLRLLYTSENTIQCVLQ